MASQLIAESRQPLSVGAVFERSVNVIKANPVATLGITFAMITVPQLLVGQAVRLSSFAGKPDAGFYTVIGLYGAVVGLLSLVVVGGLVHAAIAHDQGRPADIREMAKLGLHRALPLLVVNILFILGVWIASIFLLVPGIMLAVMWAVSMPAIVAERTGVVGAFGRSRALTKGARWRVFGIGLLTLVIYMLVTIGVGIMGVAGYGAFGALAGGVQLRNVTPPSLLIQLAQSVVTTVMLTWFTLVGASLFIELRHWKDGPDVERLTEIFA